MAGYRRLALIIATLLIFVGAGTPPSSHAQSTGALARTVPTQILVDAQGKTLYAFAQDGPNQSTCTGECAKFWPPLLIPSGVEPPAALAGIAGKFGVTTRDDGTQQLTYDGAPLYTFIEDAQAGDMHGQGLFGSWWAVVAPPAATQGAAGSSLVGTAPADALATASGMTLYVFSADTADQIACTGTCARFWTALRAAPGTSPLSDLLTLAGNFALTLRPDGGQQVTYDGAPLYTFTHDAQPGDMHGQGVASAWWVVVVPAVSHAGVTGAMLTRY